MAQHKVPEIAPIYGTLNQPITIDSHGEGAMQVLAFVYRPLYLYPLFISYPPFREFIDRPRELFLRVPYYLRVGHPVVYKSNGTYSFPIYAPHYIYGTLPHKRLGQIVL